MYGYHEEKNVLKDKATQTFPCFVALRDVAREYFPLPTLLKRWGQYPFDL